MRTTTVTCAGCGISFEKSNGELKRRLAKGRPLYCTKKCAADSGLKYNLGDYFGKGDLANFKGKLGRGLDDLSPFRFFLNRALYRCKKKGYETDLDVEYLQAIWEAQKGICPLSGVEMELPIGTAGWEDATSRPTKGSIDRIDSSKGYLKGNVRFVSLIANYAKSIWSDAEVLDFCQAVVNSNK